MDNRYINTIDFGCVPIRRTHKDGKTKADIEISGGGHAEIRTDYRTNQPFSVLFNEDWMEL